MVQNENRKGNTKLSSSLVSLSVHYSVSVAVPCVVLNSSQLFQVLSQINSNRDVSTGSQRMSRDVFSRFPSL